LRRQSSAHGQGSRPRQVAYVADAVDALPPRAANANDDTADQKYGDMSQRQLPIILALGTTQTLAWASSYYLPALLADPMARDLGISSNWVFGAFSASLVISALLGPRDLRRRRGQCVCAIPRLRQRHPDHRARHAAAVDLRPQGFRLSPRHHRRAGTDGAGRGAAGLWPAHRRHGRQGADRLLRAQPLGAGRAVHDPRATAAGLTGPELSRTSAA
jgi:hypothetical protein